MSVEHKNLPRGQDEHVCWSISALLQIKLGTIDQDEAQVEWEFRNFINTSKKQKVIGEWQSPNPLGYFSVLCFESSSHSTLVMIYFATVVGMYPTQYKNFE